VNLPAGAAKQFRQWYLVNGIPRWSWAVAQKPSEFSVDNVFVLFTRGPLGRLAQKELIDGIPDIATFKPDR
jgi:hypothetical protein